MSRATTPAVAVLVLVTVTILVAASVGAILPASPGDPPPVADLALSVDAGADRVTVRHAGGDAIPTDSLRVRVRVDGEPLAHQPPVPFFAARGFRGGPTGPFNPATSRPWRAGQTAEFELASTNDPLIEPGDRVRVSVASGEVVVADLSAVAG